MKNSTILRVMLVVAVILALYGVLSEARAQDPRTYIHPRALALMPVIKKEVDTHMPQFELPWYIPALFEHESCISFRHSKCWNSQAELRNNREHGLGLGQLTRAWDANGKLRFDNLEAYRKKYPKELWELSWATFKDRPDLQIRVGIMMVRDIRKNFSDLSDDRQALPFVDSAYNGGESHVKRARQLCHLTTNCDSGLWFGHVEKHLPKSRTPDKRYGGRSLYQINVHHVVDVTVTRMPKFKPFFQTDD